MSYLSFFLYLVNVMSLISIPLFKTDGKEELVSQDVYKLTNSEPVNKVFEAAKNVGKNALDFVGGRQGLINGVTNLIALKQSGADGKTMLQNALSGWGVNKQSLLAGGGVLLDKAADYMGVNPDVMNKVKLTSDGVTRIVTGDKEGGLKSLLGIAGGLTNDPGALRAIDIGMEAAVWGSAISQSVKYSYPDMMYAVSANTDPEVMYWAMIYASDTVMSQGNIEAHEAMLKTLTPEVVLGHNPDYIRNFLAAFTITPEWDVKTYPEKAILLDKLMSDMNPQWRSSTRAAPPVKVVNLAALAGMSADAKRLLSMIPELKDTIQMAGDFPTTTTYILCRDQYPLSVAALK